MDCFINVLRRFLSRRGTPKTIHFDNGTNLVGGAREIKEAIAAWNEKTKASHASGVWERLIRSTGIALRAILGNILVDEEVLATVLTEVEAILNSRPLCTASDDPDDQEPLTPNYLLLQKAVHNLPPGSFVKEDLFSRKKWRQANRGTQREYSSKPLKHSIVKRILVFKR